jgi:hypothetical protein
MERVTMGPVRMGPVRMGPGEDGNRVNMRIRL